MSLQGTLETFALPDVLVLLSSTKKSGELKVVGTRAEGRLWVDKGQIVQSEIRGKGTRAVDAVWELLRLDKGTFSFANDEVAPEAGQPELVDLVLSDAQGRLSEWREIEKVVPHLDAVVDMATAAPGDEVIVSAEQWKLLVAVAGGRDIHTLMDRLQLSEFDTCKCVKDLVESNMATIDIAAQPKVRPDTPAPKEVARPAEPAPKVEAKVEPPKPAEANGTAEPAKAEPKVEEKADVRPEPAKVEAPAARADEADAGARATRRVRSTTSAEGDKDAPRIAAIKEGDGPEPPKGDDPAADKAEADELVAQLAALGVDEDDAEIKEKVAAHLAEGGALPTTEGGDEHINRGLLLKFLSSVRS